MNHLNPSIRPKDYERKIGDVLERMLTNSDPRSTSLNDKVFGKLWSKLARTTTTIQRWEGASGYAHQIDESFTSNEAIVLVECKHWSSTIDVSTFLAFVARIIDIQNKHREKLVKGLLVTTQGADGRMGENPDGIGLLQNYFNEIGYHIEIQIVPDNSVCE